MSPASHEIVACLKFIRKPLQKSRKGAAVFLFLSEFMSA